MEFLLEYGDYMGIGGVYSKGDKSSRFRTSKNRDRWEELLGKEKGRVKLGGPQERLALTLKGVGERSKDLGGISEKSPVKINHTEKTLQSRFIRVRRKLCFGGGMLGERAETGAGEMVAKELSL